MEIRPLHDWLIVQHFEKGEQQIGGIIIPDTAKGKRQQGQVIAAGNGRRWAKGHLTQAAIRPNSAAYLARSATSEAITRVSM
jgi:chaperonin GroES